MALPDINAWRVETLRFTFFFREVQSGRGTGWWKSLTGQEPDTVTSRPQVGEHIESGAFDDGQLELKVAINRVDWTLNFPFAMLSDAPAGKDVAAQMIKLFGKVLEWKKGLALPVTRVAFGFVGMFPVESIAKGNELLCDFAPYMNFDTATASDVMVQINRPEVSNIVPSLNLNYVNKLGVLTGQFMQLAMGGFPQLTFSHVLRLEYDFSTPFDWTEPLPEPAVYDIFETFSNKAIAALTEGR